VSRQHHVFQHARGILNRIPAVGRSKNEHDGRRIVIRIALRSHDFGIHARQTVEQIGPLHGHDPRVLPPHARRRERTGLEYGGELAVFDLHRTIAAATAPRFDKLQQFIFHNTRFMQI